MSQSSAGLGYLLSVTSHSKEALLHEESLLAGIDDSVQEGLAGCAALQDPQQAAHHSILPTLQLTLQGNITGGAHGGALRVWVAGDKP